jgi:glycosyltransferase involved in cell wall biosynthesis
VAVLFHESEALGAGLSTLRVAHELESRGWTMSGWFPGPGPLLAESAGDLESQGQLPKPIAFNVRGWWRPPGIGVRLTATPRYLRAFRAWLRETQPDLVHANSLLMLPEATVAHRLGLPIVVQLHELPPPRLKRTVTLRWAAAIGDVLIGVSTPVSQMLGEHAGRTPVVTVRNGVAEFDRPRLERDDFLVGSVGYISRTKGTDVYLRAAELALRSRPELRFEHAGAARLWGDDEYDRSVDELATSPALRSRLRFLGSTSVPDALARWKIFVLSSRQDAFPLSTLEAMAAELPVIATKVGGLPEQVTHLETGVLVRPEAPREIAEWIVRLHDDPELRARLGAAARRRVRESFTLAAQAEGLRSAYDEAVRRRARRRKSAPHAIRAASRYGNE